MPYASVLEEARLHFLCFDKGLILKKLSLNLDNAAKFNIFYSQNTFVSYLLGVAVIYP